MVFKRDDSSRSGSPGRSARLPEVLKIGFEERGSQLHMSLMDTEAMYVYVYYIRTHIYVYLRCVYIYICMYIYIYIYIYISVHCSSSIL